MTLIAILYIIKYKTGHGDKIYLHYQFFFAQNYPFHIKRNDGILNTIEITGRNKDDHTY